VFDRPKSSSRAAVIVPLILMGCGHQPDAEPGQQAVYTQQRCGGPSVKWGEKGAETGELMTYNRLDVGSSAMRWNGKVINMATLHRYVSEVPKLNPQPITVVVAAPRADCGIIKNVRRLLDAELKCSASHACVEYSQAEWAKWHPPLPLCDADCEAYGRAGGSDRRLTPEQKQRLKKNYIDKYGFIPW
jgi:hypothetical protein